MSAASPVSAPRGGRRSLVSWPVSSSMVCLASASWRSSYGFEGQVLVCEGVVADLMAGANDFGKEVLVVLGVVAHHVDVHP